MNLYAYSFDISSGLIIFKGKYEVIDFVYNGIFNHLYAYCSDPDETMHCFEYPGDWRGIICLPYSLTKKQIIETENLIEKNFYK